MYRSSGNDKERRKSGNGGYGRIKMDGKPEDTI
jgi:hypothetical protein